MCKLDTSKKKRGMDRLAGSGSRLIVPKLSVLLVAGSLPVFMASAHADTSFERLSALLAAAPEGGWVKASTNVFSNAWPTGPDAVPGSYGFPHAVVRAWSSFAWDSTRGNLILWGGGHANYAGNEVYVWDGATGNWGLGSLPSRVDPRTGFVIDSSAPQSSHTYDNNLYLPVNDMFLTLGGAAWITGGGFQKTDGTTVSRAGPFLWDPNKADPMKVGGVTGSGWNTAEAVPGGNMWIDRQGEWTGIQPRAMTTSAYRTENGQDVIYLTAETGAASGFPSLFRYTLGDVRNGEQDKWERIGISWNTVGFQGTGTIDNVHNLYIKTATISGSYTSDLAVWDLDKANAANPNSNADIGINLVKEDGSDFVITGNYGIDYDPVNNQVLLWDGGAGGGTVWSANVITDADGNIGANTTWIVTEIESATHDHPHGNFATGVLGKWHYDATLGAFIALDEATSIGGGAWDASVWLYKPISAAVVPEPEMYALFLAGLGLVGWKARRRSFA